MNLKQQRQFVMLFVFLKKHVDVLDKKMVELILVRNYWVMGSKGDVKIQITEQQQLKKKWIADENRGKEMKTKTKTLRDSVQQSKDFRLSVIMTCG